MQTFDISEFKRNPVIFDKESMDSFDVGMLGIQAEKKSYSNKTFGGYCNVGYKQEESFNRVLFSLEDVEMTINRFQNDKVTKYSLNVFLDPKNNETHHLLIENIVQSYKCIVEHLSSLNERELNSLMSACGGYRAPKKGNLKEIALKHVLSKFNIEKRMKDVYINEDFSIEYGNDVRIYVNIDNKFAPSVTDINGEVYTNLSKISQLKLTGLLTAQLGAIKFVQSGIIWSLEARSIVIRNIKIEDEMDELRQKYIKKIPKADMEQLKINMDEILKNEESEEDNPIVIQEEDEMVEYP